MLIGRTEAASVYAQPLSTENSILKTIEKPNKEIYRYILDNLGHISRFSGVQVMLKGFPAHTPVSRPRDRPRFLSQNCIMVPMGWGP